MKKVKLILVACLFLCLSCERDDNGNRVTYYKTIGEGYIFDRDSNQPLEGIKIIVMASTDTVSGLLTQSSLPGTQETFTTDKDGYYQIKFAKRVGNHKVIRYQFRIDPYPALPVPTPPALFWSWETSANNGPFTDINGYMYPSDIKDKQTITFEPLKFYSE